MYPILKSSRKILTFKYYAKFAFIQIRDSMGAHLIFFIVFTLFSCIILTNQSLPWSSLRSGFQCDTKMAAVFSCMRPTGSIEVGTLSKHVFFTMMIFRSDLTSGLRLKMFLWGKTMGLLWFWSIVFRMMDTWHQFALTRGSWYVGINFYDASSCPWFMVNFSWFCLLVVLLGTMPSRHKQRRSHGITIMVDTLTKPWCIYVYI